MRDPIPPRALREIERVMAHGDGKYPPENYLNVNEFDHYRAALKHGSSWLGGETADPDSGLDPLAHAALRLMMALEVQLVEKERV